MVVSAAFLFLVRLRFPSNSSAIDVIEFFDENDIANLERKSEMLDLKYQKTLLDLGCLLELLINSLKMSIVILKN